MKMHFIKLMQTPMIMSIFLNFSILCQKKPPKPETKLPVINFSLKNTGK